MQTFSPAHSRGMLVRRIGIVLLVVGCRYSAIVAYRDAGADTSGAHTAQNHAMTDGAVVHEWHRVQELTRGELTNVAVGQDNTGRAFQYQDRPS